MIEPETKQPSEWSRLKITQRGSEPNSNDEAAVDDYVSSRYEAAVRLPRGKYEVAFRVPNQAGAVEECSSVVLIVADAEDYNL